MNLMSKSCFSPGIINFISNLISTTGDQGDMESAWLREYAEGMDHEIYRIKLSVKMENRTFAEIAGFVYKKNQSIVFAIEIKTNGKTIIRLHPSDFIVNNIQKNQIYFYLICPDKKTADEIVTLDMTKDEINKYLNAKLQAEKIAKEARENDEESDMDDNNIFNSDKGMMGYGGPGDPYMGLLDNNMMEGVDELYQ